MMYILTKRLVWLALLSCLIPGSAGSDCDVATGVTSGTCAAVGAAAGFLSIFACIGTLGVGCIVTSGVIAATSACAAIADSVQCESGVEPSLESKLDEITQYVKDIQDSVDKLYDKVEIEFFEAKYLEYINKIRAASARYQLDVIEKSTDENGLIKNNILVREWIDDALGDGDYNVRGALDIIEGMITGTDGIGLTKTPSIYELALKHEDICEPQLYEFVTSLIMEGTTLAFIALEMRGDGVHPADRDQLAERLQWNEEHFRSDCQGWISVQKHQRVSHDLESFPLKIKTDFEIGDGRMVDVRFNNAQGEEAGRIQIDFEDPITYTTYCHKSFRAVPFDLPKKGAKVWTITKLPGPRLILHCNGKLVEDIIMTDPSACWYQWGVNMYWKKDAKEVWFGYKFNPPHYYWRPSPLPEWLPVAEIRGIHINHDLERIPFLIMINSTEVPSGNDLLMLTFRTATRENVESFFLQMSNPARYLIGGCSTSWTTVPLNLATTGVKVLTITKLPGPRLTVHCNGEEVLDTALCWTEEVKGIIISDNISDYYRPGAV